jgi:hypothetical protein
MRIIAHPDMDALLRRGGGAVPAAPAGIRRAEVGPGGQGEGRTRWGSTGEGVHVASPLHSDKTAAEVCRTVGIGRRTLFTYLAQVKHQEPSGSSPQRDNIAGGDVCRKSI